jgi:cobyrinic acid a,c-diamide synthase
VIPKEGVNFFPERHMGLVPPQEHGELQVAVAHVAERIREGVDLDGLREVAERADPLGWVPSSGRERNRLPGRAQVTIGIVRDAAFQFYYPENLEALEKQGAALKFIDGFQCEVLPPVDALYIGGGFPETHLNQLTANKGLRESIGQAVEKGLPVYAECGGLMFLSRGIHHQGEFYPMCGVFPCDVVLERKPQGHGYAILECVGENPFVPAGRLIRGHEFHYSKVVDLSPDVPLVFRLQKGHGIV